MARFALAPRPWLTALIVLLPVALHAQVSDPVMAAQAPIPGSDHHYIGIGAETVNPADGSLSYDLPLQPPAGRELSMPFGIRYFASDQFHVVALPNNPVLTWGANLVTPFQVAGWSYNLPTYTAEVYAKFDGNSPTYPYNPLLCDITENYLFTGFDGTRRNLETSSQWRDLTYPDPNCSAFPNNGSLSSNVHGWLLTTPTFTASPDPPQLTVTDPSGTAYQFPTGFGINVLIGPNGQNGPPTMWGLLAQTITDRNGNQISLKNNQIVNGAISYAGNAYVDTLGRQLISWTGVGNNGDTITIAGLSSSIVLRWGTATVSFPEAGHPAYGTSLCALSSGSKSPTQIPFLDEIDLPNGQKYTFSSDGTYGRIGRITFPDGGYVRYVWGLDTSSAVVNLLCNPSGTLSYENWIFDTPAITDRYVSYDGTTEVLHQHFTYAPTTWSSNQNSAHWTAKTTTVTSTDLVTSQSAVIQYSYSSMTPDLGPQDFTIWNVPQVAVESAILYQDGAGHTLRTVNKTWKNTVAMNGEQTILDNGQGMTSLRCYNSNEQITNLYAYGFQGEGTYPGDPSCVSSTGLTVSALGPLRRQTTTVYQSFSAVHIGDAPSSVTTADGSGNTVKQTLYSYDQSALQSSGAINLTNPGSQRANATTIQRLINGANYATITYAYYDTGQVASMTDPCGNGTCTDMPTGANHTTTFSYTDSWLSGDTYTTFITPPSGNTNAYPTKITDALGHIKTFSYDYPSGQITAAEDENLQTSNHRYDDILARATKSTFPDGGQAEVAYNDTAPSPTVTTCQLINGTANATCSATSPASGWKTSMATMDGMRHVVQAKLASDPDGVTYTATKYDGSGRTYQVYNPTRCSPPTTNCGTETTWGYTASSYDALGRISSVVEQDGSNVTTTYSGNQTTVTDEVGNQRKSQTDSLGRLSAVWEAPTVTGYNYETDYQYDALDNLICAVQKGTDTTAFTTCAAAPATWRPRAFTYDSLSRLLTAANPESGTITYSYDLNGNLTTKVAPQPGQTGTGQSTTHYSYDALNRLTIKTYMNPNFGSAQYGYDGVALTTCNIGPPSISSPTNLIGRRSGSCSELSASKYSYDPIGRQIVDARRNKASAMAAVTYTAQYGYFKDGSLNTLTYPSGDVFTYTVGGAGRVTQVSDPSNSYVGYSANPVTYAPSGALKGMINGHTTTFGGITTSNIYNDRLQPILLSASLGSTAAFSLCYDFHLHIAISNSPCAFSAYSTGDNGNAFQILNNVDSTRSQTFKYDPLNRISQGNTITTTGSNCWGEIYTIDPWGNLTNRGGVSGMTGCSTEGLSSSASTKNQLGILTYDAAGNVTNDGNGNLPTYDAENRIATDAGVSYYYDADGVRTEKSSGTMYWPGPTGVLAETNLSGTINEEYVYFNGQRLARVDRPSGTVHYYFSDNLGSASVITDNSGNVQERYFYYPYGGMQSTVGSDPNHYKFTGKERDTESNLDYFRARYFTSNLGRFMTPDWAARPTTVPYAGFDNPQSLNLYSYVKNNPTTLTDPNGHCDVDGEHHKWVWCAAHAVGITETKKEQQAELHQAAQNMRRWWADHGVRLYQHGNQVNPNNMSDQQVLGAASWYWQAYFSSDDGEVNTYTGAVAGAILNTASQIASGHGWAKHQGEFPGWDQGKYEDTVRETMQQPDEVRTLSNNRTAYWNAKENMVVVENPADPDGGTAFRPTNGKAYFDGLK